VQAGQGVRSRAVDRDVPALVISTRPAPRSTERCSEIVAADTGNAAAMSPAAISRSHTIERISRRVRDRRAPKVASRSVITVALLERSLLFRRLPKYGKGDTAERTVI